MKVFFARVVLWVLCAGSFLGFNILLYFSAGEGHTGWDVLIGFYTIAGGVAAMTFAAHWALKTIRDHKNKG